MDDAEIEEVFKQVVVGKSDKMDVEKPSTPREQSIVWLLPANSKFFDVDGCLKKHNEIYWTQNYKIQKGDIVYIYSSSPDSCIKYKLKVEAHDVTYHTDFDKEKEFYVDVRKWRRTVSLKRPQRRDWLEEVKKCTQS